MARGDRRCHDASVIDEPLLSHARRLWIELAGATEAGVTVSPGSRLCPPGWAGIVSLGDTVIATAPDDRGAETLRRALRGLPAAATTDPAVVRARLPVSHVLGPATLAFGDSARFRPADPAEVGTVAAADLGELVAGVSDEDAAEAGLDEITSAAFVVRRGGIVAAAGYGVWPVGTAHISVLTAPQHRGRGLARLVASAAVADALDRGLVPQWRARPEPSRRVARALGLVELGAQLSIRVRREP